MKDLIIVRGGGDIATGTIYKLVKSGFHVLSDDLFWMLYDRVRYRGDHPVKSYPQTRTAEKRP